MPLGVPRSGSQSLLESLFGASWANLRVDSGGFGGVLYNSKKWEVLCNHFGVLLGLTVLGSVGLAVLRHFWILLGRFKAFLEIFREPRNGSSRADDQRTRRVEERRSMIAGPKKREAIMKKQMSMTEARKSEDRELIIEGSESVIEDRKSKTAN